MIAALVPPGVAVAVARPQDYEGALELVEAQHVARAVARRRREFSAGRACARRAMAELGRPAVAIPVGGRLQPLWPDEIVGSITHCDGYCAAVVASTATLAIDAERRRPLAAGTLACFCTPAERAAMAAVRGELLPLLVFSAKEAFFKAWYSITARRLDYLQAEVAFDVDAASFSPRLTDGSLLPAQFCGRFAVTPTHVFTAVSVAP